MVQYIAAAEQGDVERGAGEGDDHFFGRPSM
jgi:hypothetical protein